MSSHSLHQEICLTQGLNPGLPHCRQILYHLSPQGSPYKSWLRTSVTFCYLEPVLGFLIPGLLQHACFIKAYKKKENYRVYYQEKNITLFCNQIIELIASVCGHTVLLIKNKSLNGNELCKAENPRGWDQVRPPEWLPVAMVVLIAQLFPTLRKPIDCSPGSSVLGILQARILQWDAIPFFRGSSHPGIEPGFSHIEGRFLTV